MEQSRKDCITNPDESTDDRDSYAYHARISDQFLLGGPGHLLQFRDNFVQELLQLLPHILFVLLTIELRITSFPYAEYASCRTCNTC